MTEITQHAPDIVSVLAPNPSPMTERGTNSYLVGTDSLAVIDPGPMMDAHLDALLGAIGTRPVEAILVTHAHLDHSPLARPLAKATGAPVLAYGDATAGRSAVMEQLAAEGLAGGGEGVDHDFRPDRCLSDGETVTGDGWALTALWTPGHFGNHLCFASGSRLFSGDLVMGWSSSLVSPPDGDLTEFMTSCARLQETRWSVMYSGHGAPIEDPAERLNWLIEHRRGREAQIRAALTEPMTLDALVAQVYTDLPKAAWPAAARNLFAHLVDLHSRGLIEAEPSLGVSAEFLPKE